MIRTGPITPASAEDPDLGGFTRRIPVVLLVVALAFALWRLADLLLLLFGAIVIAVGLRAAYNKLAAVTRTADAAALSIVVILCLAAFGAVFWLFGTTISDQLDEVIKQAPAGLALLSDQVQAHPYGRFLLDQAREVGAAGATGWLGSAVATIARVLGRGIGYGILTFFVAIYLAAQPDLYQRFCVRLVPPAHRPRANRLLNAAAAALRRWLLGQLVVMATIGLLSGLGLWALGIEAAFALGLAGGLLTFIPYVGAVLAAVPATLVALTQGPGYAASVVLMYVAVHFVEGNFITPLVQAEASSLPPVLLLLSTVAFSILFGPSAVLLAAPLTLVLLVVIEVLYVEQALGQPAALPGVTMRSVPGDVPATGAR